MKSKRKVVVTGLGMATALGLNVTESWEKALAGESGIRRLKYPDTEKAPVRAAGAVAAKDVERIKQDFPESASREGEQRTLFALWAAASALRDAAAINPNGDRGRYGVSLAAGLGINRLEDLQRWIKNRNEFDLFLFGQEYAAVHRESIIKNNSNRASTRVAQEFGLGGPNLTVTTACASATQAIGTAYRTIVREEADMMVAGGADSMINPIGLIFFVLLGAAATKGANPAEMCKPFDRRRAGLVLGEGCGIAILEEEQHAIQRGARIYAEVAGYSSTMDAYQVTAPHPQGLGAEKCMRKAIEDAALSPQDIDYINAHGTGTKLNDKAETTAIKNVFQAHAYKIDINSSKSLFGHLLAASGGPEFVFTVLSVQGDILHPTINLTHPDPKCDLNYVPNVKKTRRVRAAISNSFGFGGQNASVVVKKYAAN